MHNYIKLYKTWTGRGKNYHMCFVQLFFQYAVEKFFVGSSNDNTLCRIEVALLHFLPFVVVILIRCQLVRA